MTVSAPHFHLYAEAAPVPNSTDCGTSSRWRFVLRLPSGETSFEAADEEPEASPERAELFAIIRGLEALEQPSRVTLLTASRRIRRGLDFGLAAWRESNWQWERYGRMTPITNGDLWRRLDRLLEIHVLEVRPMRLEPADDLAPARRITLNGQRLRFDTEHKRGEASCRSFPGSAGERSSGGSAATSTAGRRASGQFRSTQSVRRRKRRWSALIGFVLQMFCPSTRSANNHQTAAAYGLRRCTTEEMARA